MKRIIEMKTIKQIADEIGVSKQAVQQRLNKPPLETTAKPLLQMVDNAWRVPLEAEELILKAFSDSQASVVGKLADNEPASLPTTSSTLVDELVSMLQNELENKNGQIVSQQGTIDKLTETVQEQMQQIERLTSSLQAEQALHAGTMQQQLTSGVDENIVDDQITPEPEASGSSRRSWWPFGKKK